VNLRAALDEVDARIIEELNIDGRMSFAEIARRIDVNEATVRSRYARLIRRKMIRIVAIADAIALGLVFAEVGVKVSGSPVAAVAEELGTIPEVDYVAICAGSFDLLIEVVCPDNDRLLAVLDEKIRAVRGVSSVETFVILDVAKHSYRWPSLIVDGDPSP
jgi:Lrp/AsnC family transcriptional regulator, regulator for asnA, asnC and gidA